MMGSILVDPFHLPPGPAFLGYFAAWTVGLTLLVRWVDTRVAAAATRAENAARAYRGLPMVEELELGRFPRGSQVWIVAWLRGDAPRFAETLLAAACVLRWWTPLPSGAFQLALPKHAGADPWLQVLHRRLREHAQFDGPVITAEALFTITRKVACATQAPLEHSAISSGFRRSHATRRTTAALIVVALCLLEVPAVVRIFTRLTVDPLAPTPLYLFAAMFIAALVFLFGSRPSALLPAGRAYLRWLDDATASMRVDVQEGRRDVAFDIALTVALAGVSSIAAVPLLAAFATAYQAHVQTLTESVTDAWSVDGAFGSFCGGGSCGSGCGGGGCGGGGCS